MLNEMLEWGATIADLLKEYGVSEEELFEENED